MQPEEGDGKRSKRVRHMLRNRWAVGEHPIEGVDWLIICLWAVACVTLFAGGFERHERVGETVFRVGDGTRRLWAIAFGGSAVVMGYLAVKPGTRARGLLGLAVLVVVAAWFLPGRLSARIVISETGVWERAWAVFGGRAHGFEYADVDLVVTGAKTELRGRRTPRTTHAPYWSVHRRDGTVDSWKLSGYWRQASKAITDAALDHGVRFRHFPKKHIEDVLETRMLSIAWRLDARSGEERLAAFLLGEHLHRARNVGGTTFLEHWKRGGTGVGTWVRRIPIAPDPFEARMTFTEDGTFAFRVTFRELDETVTGTWKLSNEKLEIVTEEGSSTYLLPTG